MVNIIISVLYAIIALANGLIFAYEVAVGEADIDKLVICLFAVIICGDNVMFFLRGERG